jgi:hypothetical protein
VEVGDAADHRSAGDNLVAVHGKLGQELSVFGVALDQAVARVSVEAALERSVLAVVVDADDLVTGAEQLGNEITADESGGSGD